MKEKRKTVEENFKFLHAGQLLLTHSFTLDKLENTYFFVFQRIKREHIFRTDTR